MTDELAGRADRERGEVEGDANRDPLTGTPGAHPVGVAAGAAGAGAAGAAMGGAVGGPAGAAVGATVGAVAGALAGKGVAEGIDPTVEDEYWRENYASRPYATADRAYETYRPAYQYGWESWGQYRGRPYEEVEPELERGWESARGSSTLPWAEARYATRDAWSRADERVAGAPPRDTV